MSAIFNFQSLLTVILLMICSCAYIRAFNKGFLDSHKKGLRGMLWKLARIGERLSPWVSISCIAMGINVLFFK